MMQLMKAVVMDETGPRLEKRPVPDLTRTDDVLVKVAASGICGTDRAIVLGEFPAADGVILGHEAAGVVAATGPDVTVARPGERVVINPTYFCGACQYCRRGLPAHCTAKDGREIGVDRDGTMAEYVAVPVRSVLPMPAGMTYRTAALVEPLACVLNNIRVAAPRRDDYVVVLGGGPIGALTAMLLAHLGHRVTLAEPDRMRARRATRILPAAVTVEATGRPAGLGTPDVLIDTTGFLLAEALERVADGGTVLVMGEREGVAATVAARPLATRGIRLAGAGPYAPRHFQHALDLAQHLPLDTLVTNQLPLDDFAEALASLAAGPAHRAAESVGYQQLKVLLVSDPELIAKDGASR